MRNNALDVAKLLACFFIIVVHVTTQNATFDGTTGVVDLTGTTAKVYCKNVKAPIASGYVPFSSNAGTYYLSGDVDTDGSNTLATSNAGTIRLMRGIHNIACDLTKLTSVDNSGCYNSNASLSCGVGMVSVQKKYGSICILVQPIQAVVNNLITWM